MIEGQKLINIEIKDLVEKVTEFRCNSYRLVKIGCTKTDILEINYSFDKDYNFVTLRIILPCADIEVPSVSHIYWSAFIYENEIKDLFGIRINNIAIDYKGNFYRTVVKFPFNTPNTGNTEGTVPL